MSKNSTPAHIAEGDRTLILVGIMLALFLAALDQTIVSTALPRIVEDLEGVSRYAWVATAYLLASTALVPVYGKLADTYSRKRVELGAVILFLTGSVLCGLSGEFGRLPVLGDGMTQLIVFRGIQGAGGAGIFAMTFIVIADLFTPAQRGRYQGLVGGVWGIASVLGPLLGGLLTDHAGGVIPGVEGWRWVFYVNLPVGAVALWFIIRRMPRLEPVGEKGKLDVVSAGYLVGGLVPLILSLQIDKRRFPWLPGMGPDAGAERWQSWVTLGLFVLAVALLTAFWRRSRSSDNPILDLKLFDNRVFHTANSANFFFGAAFMSVVIFLPLFLVNVVGVSATGAGVALIPFSMGLVVGSTGAGNLAARIGHLKHQILAGGLLLLVPTVLLARMDADVSYGMVTLYMVLGGLGMGPSLPLFTLAIQNAVDVRRVGQATSAAQFFRQIGGTVGAAIMGTVLATSLGMSFANLKLPLSFADAPVASAERLSSTGGGGLPDRIRASYDSLAAEIAAAARARDEEALDRLARHPDLPTTVSVRLAGAVDRGMDRLDEETIQGLAQGVPRILERTSETVAGQVAEEIRQAFTRATNRVYWLTTWLVVIAVALTLRIPEIPLRDTHDREELAGG